MKTEAEESIDMESTDLDLKVKTETCTLEHLPLKSKAIYENCYKKFMNWRVEQNHSSFSENVLIAYLTDLSTKLKPSSLWAQYSMLKATLYVKHGINIRNYSKITSYIKRKSYGYLPNKSKILTKAQINQFISEAPDKQYLMTKVALIIGIAGALRREELLKIRVQDIDDLGRALLIKIPKTKTNKPKSFAVTGNDHLEVYRKYLALRPSNFSEPRFFIKYTNGKCCRQVVGINKLSLIAQNVARYLNLPDIKAYTSHCIRRTSATLRFDVEADLTDLKGYTSWQSLTVAENDEPLPSKVEMLQNLLGGKSSTEYTANVTVNSNELTSTISTTIENNKLSHAPIYFNNCTIHFNISSLK